LYFGGAIFRRSFASFSAASILALDPLRHVLVGDTFDLKRMQAAEIGDLLEGERGIIDKPDGCRFGHQGNIVGHESIILSPGGVTGSAPLSRP
jgi:hypothetical protein